MFYPDQKRKVSVIIPTHNARETIERCIDSVIVQSYKNVEIIVVDDGSTDGTASFVSNKYSGIVILEQANLGVSAARNLGLKKSSGYYVVFVDADDELKPFAIEMMVECSIKNKARIVKTSSEEIYRDKKKKIDLGPLSNRIVNFNNENDRKTIIENFFGAHAGIMCLVTTLLLEKDLITKKKFLFDTRLYMMEDTVFYVDMFLAGEDIYFLNEPLYVHYVYQNSSSHNPDNLAKIIKGVLDANSEINKRLSDNVDINNKHFMMIVELVAKFFLNNRSIIWVEGLDKLALKTNFSHEKQIWRIARSAVIRKNKFVMRLIIIMKAMKLKVNREERPI